MKKIVYFIFLAICSSCTNNNEEDMFNIPCQTDNIFYLANDSERSIATIISNKCIGCHFIGNMISGVSLESYSDLTSYNDLEDIINNTSNPMPPVGSNPLTDCEKLKISSWINNNSPDYE